MDYPHLRNKVYSAGPAETFKNWVGPINPGLTGGPFLQKTGWALPYIFPPKSGWARFHPAHTYPSAGPEYAQSS